MRAEVLQLMSEILEDTDDKVLSRARGYINKILQLEITDNEVTARVKGSEREPYHIWLPLDSLSSFGQCSCPAYKPCKHMAAVALRIQSSNPTVEYVDERVMNLEPGSLAMIIFNSEYLKLYVRRENELELIEEQYQCKALDDEIGSVVAKVLSGYRGGHKVRLNDRLEKLIEEHENITLLNNDLRKLSYGGIAKFTSIVEDANYDGDSCKVLLPCAEVEEGLIPLQFNGEANLKFVFEPTQNKHYHFYRLPEKLSLPEDFESKKNQAFYYSIAVEDSIKKMQVFYNQALTLADLYYVKEQFSNADVDFPVELAELWQAGPALALTLEPGDDDNEFKIAGRLELVYAREKSHLKQKQFDSEKNKSNALENNSPQKKNDIPPPLPLPGPTLIGFAPWYKKHIAPYWQLRKTRYLFEEHPSGIVVMRNRKKEDKLKKKLESLPLKYKKRSGELTIGPRQLKNFLTETIPLLQKERIILRIHSHLISVFVKKLQANINIEESSGFNWFEGQIKIGSLSSEDTAFILQAHKNQEKLVKLKDGSYVHVDELGLDRLIKMVASLGLRMKKNGQITDISRGELIALQNEVNFDASKAVQSYLKKIAQMQSSQELELFKSGSTFTGKLRIYQADGLAFFHRLYQLQMGGILADDMGLGKTIQALAFMTSVLEQKPRAKLVVIGPLAAANVWLREAQRFCPDMPCTLWHGASRKNTKLPRNGLIITTYGTLLKDLEIFADINIECLFLDEAQNAKNFQSRSAKAIRSLKANSLFALTGTPLENHLVELWSIMHLCIPGLLGSQKSFRENFGRGTSAIDIEGLKKRINPFLLRRRKDEVLKDLPARIETDWPVAMTQKQAALYEDTRKQAIEALENSEEKRAIFLILPYLTKLRRIACHPQLENAIDTDPALSGKFLRLAEMLEQLSETANGILIFSQFTDVLKVAKTLLNNMEISFCYIDGSVSLKKREQQVTSFQAGEKKVFLISLKAGGTALTLTEADTVIHLDPWWNPAAERQASDRAHRIGQKRKVNIHRLYSEATVEEKVLKLQQRKRKLFTSLFDSEQTQTSSTSIEDIKEILQSSL